MQAVLRRSVNISRTLILVKPFGSRIFRGSEQGAMERLRLGGKGRGKLASQEWMNHRRGWQAGAGHGLSPD
jgi:hypothetical protein